MTKTLLAIGAHADDIELHAGGLAATCAARDWDVHFVMSSNNMSGNLLGMPGTSGVVRRKPAETAAVRVAEQKAAAAVIGAATGFLDYPQRHYWDGERQVSLGFGKTDHDPMPAGSALPPLVIASQNPQAIERVGNLLVQLRPTIVITHTITDFDPEHHATASLVYQAFHQRIADLPGATLLFWAPGTTSRAGMLRQSFDCILPFDESAMARKMQMLQCHASQMTPRRLEMAERRARYWGAEIESTFAEPFTTIVNPAVASLGI